MADQPDPLVVALGLAIRELRFERGWSQEELSLRSGVHRNYIGGVERAERRPSVETVGKLADALGIGVHDLIHRPAAVFLTYDGLTFFPSHALALLRVGLNPLGAVFFFGRRRPPFLDHVLQSVFAVSWHGVGESGPDRLEYQTERIILRGP